MSHSQATVRNAHQAQQTTLLTLLLQTNLSMQLTEAFNLQSPTQERKRQRSACSTQAATAKPLIFT